MKLTFLGATHEVTGSCYLLEACGKNILIDCGMEQGKDWFVNQPIPVAPGEVDMVLLTHAHIDHSGKLPLLVKQGFKGQIFSTEGTQQLCDIMLRDSAHIQEFEAEWKNRKAERAGKPEQGGRYVLYLEGSIARSPVIRRKLLKEARELLIGNGSEILIEDPPLKPYQKAEGCTDDMLKAVDTTLAGTASMIIADCVRDE